MAKRTYRFRFLPLTIFTAALMLTVKIGDIWSGLGETPGVPISVAVAQAQQAPAQGQAGDAAGDAAGEEGPPPAEPQPEVRRTIGNDPTLMTQNEIDLLQRLAERRENLDQRERQLDERLGLLQAAEARINSKVEQLRALQTAIEELIVTHERQEDTRLTSLVRIYENMKPKDAARIFEVLDLDTLLMVAERMNERKLAPVMAQMNSERAKEVTVELTRARQLPVGGEPSLR